MRKTKKLAVITGGGSGIGRALAIRLAQGGADIFLLGGRSAENLLQTAEQVRALGAACHVAEGDLTNPCVMDGAISQLAELGGADVLINNAGMAFNAPFAETEEKIFDKLMELNVKVPYFLIQKLLPQLKESKEATVVNICSVVAHAGYPLQSAYVASKHALLGATKSIAAELYELGIRVHAICPGGVYTDMVKIARPDLSAEGMIMPEEIAEIVAFLVEHRGNAVIDEILVHRINKQPFLV